MNINGEGRRRGEGRGGEGRRWEREEEEERQWVVRYLDEMFASTATRSFRSPCDPSETSARGRKTDELDAADSPEATRGGDDIRPKSSADSLD